MQQLLNQTQRNFLKTFRRNKLSEYFYWGGGTLLAYHYLHHRFSEDLDFFSNELLFDETMAAAFLEFKKNTGAKKLTEIKKINRHQLVFKYNKGSLKVEFVYFPFPAIGKRTKLKNLDITADSLEDIATNKTHAVFERSEPKDVFDLYWIIKKGKFTIAKLIKWVSRKFGVDIDPVTFIAKVISSIDHLEKIKPLIFKKTLFQPQKMRIFFEKEAFSRLKRDLT